MRPEYKTRSAYLGDGATEIYTFDFKIVNKTHLLVLNVDPDGNVVWAVRATDTTYFTTTLTGETGGSIDLVAPLPLNHRLIILLADDEPTQPAKYVTNDAYTMKQIENSFDWLSGQIQRIRYLLDRSFKLPEKFIDDFQTAMTEIVDDSVIVIEEVTPGEWAATTVPRSEFIGPAGQIDGLNVVGELEYDDPTPMSVVNSGTPTNAILDFVLRKGRTATIAIGTVTSVPPTDPATVTNVGTASDAVFDFEIPRGEDGVSTTLVTIEPNNPNNAIGSNGDLWINSVTGDLFQKELGTYGLKGNIKGPPGGLSLANSFDIPIFTDSFTVLFPGPVPDVNYVPIITLENSVDADPIMFNWMVTQRTVNGFTVKLNAPTDTANYKCLWGYTPYAP